VSVKSLARSGAPATPSNYCSARSHTTYRWTNEWAVEALSLF